MKYNTLVQIALTTICVTCSAWSGASQREPLVTGGTHDLRQGCPTPEDVASVLRAATSALQDSRPQVGVDLLKDLAPSHCDPRVDLLLAASLEESGRLREAEQDLQTSLTAWPNQSSLATSLAREYLSEGRRAEAAQAVSHLQILPDTPWQELQLATVVLLTNHQLAEAESIACAGYKLHPSLESLLLWSNSLQLEGKYKDVIALLKDKRSEYRDAPAFFITLAESEYDAAVYDSAHSDLTAAIALSPTSYQAHYLLGNTYLKTGDPAAAAAEYQVSLKLDPKQTRTYYYLALALRAEGKGQDEEEVLRKAIALDEHSALAHAELGRLLLNQGRLPDAVSQLEAAVKGNPSSEQAYYLLARAYERLGQTSQSEATTRRLSEVRRENHSGVHPEISGEQHAPGNP